MSFHRLLILMLSAAMLSACSDPSVHPAAKTHVLVDDIDVGPEDPDAKKSFFLPTGDDADNKFDAVSGARGLTTQADRSSTAVWDVRNQWTDTDTPDARQSGMAWPANSGLDWNQKYAAWVKSMTEIQSESYFRTYQLTTPFGKVLPAPALECAETSIFLRVAFASWYGLPFFLEAKDRSGNRLYLGHFGFRTAEGKYPRSPNFKTSYSDLRSQAATWQNDGWPQDERLRTRKLGGSQDDWQNFLFEGARAGAYFDEIFLNKRVGYFMIYALSYFGSMNLADTRNTYNITAEAIREGDTLLERWQRRGIGHTLVVKEVTHLSNDKLEVELISGSMPRRQGKWDNTASSRSYLTKTSAGGPGANDDGQRYAALGGGLKRWRIAQLVRGRWTNMVAPNDIEHFINSRRYDDIADRIARFESLIEHVSPEERRDVLLSRIEDKRNHLRNYPASCSARIGREEAFDDLYLFEQEQSGLSVAEVDARYRLLEDYVFAELIYQKSKTCCWNSTTSAMYEIAMAYNHSLQMDAALNQECREPLVFMNQDGGYEVFKAYAESIGRGDEWVSWTEDERCPQRGVEIDTEEVHRFTDFCAYHERVTASVQPQEPEPVRTIQEDDFEPNNSADGASFFEFQTSAEVALCPGNEDWFEFYVDSQVTIDATFVMALGDLDIALFNGEGQRVGLSEETDDDERIHLTNLRSGYYRLQIYHFDSPDACQAYTLSVY